MTKMDKKRQQRYCKNQSDILWVKTSHRTHTNPSKTGVERVRTVWGWTVGRPAKSSHRRIETRPRSKKWRSGRAWSARRLLQSKKKTSKKITSKHFQTFKLKLILNADSDRQHLRSKASIIRLYSRIWPTRFWPYAYEYEKLWTVKNKTNKNKFKTTSLLCLTCFKMLQECTHHCVTGVPDREVWICQFRRRLTLLRLNELVKSLAEAVQEWKRMTHSLIQTVNGEKCKMYHVQRWKRAMRKCVKFIRKAEMLHLPQNEIHFSLRRDSILQNTSGWTRHSRYTDIY